ncbi:MAG: amidase, partial [Actinomycetota bacterium]
MTRVDESLDLIERWQPVTNAFSQVWPKDAREAAGWAPEGPLRGVPVVVKDLFDVAGRETTGCSRAYDGNVAEDDAELVGALRVAGAVLVGKTNMHELAMGGTNQVSACGPTANPWDPSRITGGSSGGSAAAVATRCVSMALGTDTGGSIRNPSVLCGCWGLKPTHGRLSLDGVMPLAPSLDCPGPMAVTAAELGRLWRVLSGPSKTPGLPRRAGLLGGFFASHIHPEIRKAVGAVRRGLESLGIEVVDVDGEGIEFAFESWPDFVCMELVESHPELPERRDRLFPPTAGFVARGTGLTDEEKAALRKRPDEAGEWFARRFDGVD